MRTRLYAFISIGLMAVSGCYRNEAPAEYVPSLDARERLQQAIALEEQGKTLEALARAAEAVDLDNRYADAQYWRAVLLARQGRFEDARVALELLSAQHPEHVQGQVLKGLLLERSGEVTLAKQAYGAAAAVLEERGEGGRQSPDEIIEKAIVLYLYRGTTLGLQQVNSVLDEHPDYAPARMIQARIHADDRNYFLNRALRPGKLTAPDGTAALPIASSADAGLTSELLEPLPDDLPTQKEPEP